MYKTLHLGFSTVAGYLIDVKRVIVSGSFDPMAQSWYLQKVESCPLSVHCHLRCQTDLFIYLYFLRMNVKEFIPAAWKPYSAYSSDCFPKMKSKFFLFLSFSGPGLVFVVYPEALAKFPVPQLWSVMFFAMLLSIGVGSQVKCCDLFYDFNNWVPYTAGSSPERSIVTWPYSADLDCHAPVCHFLTTPIALKTSSDAI